MGDDETLRRQVEEFAAAGVTSLTLSPMAATAEERRAHVRQLIEIVRS